MRRITIVPDEGRVLGYVRDSAEYTAAKAERQAAGGQTGMYDAWRMVKEDEPLLRRFYNEGLAAFKALLAPYAKENTSAGGVVLDIATNFDMSLLPSLRDSAECYLVDYVLAQWFTYLSQATPAQAFEQSAAATAAAVTNILGQRLRPETPEYDNEYNIIRRNVKEW
ncbi:MAG: hypothetical protein LUC22_02740 [Prevotella sp.]|nr:hypothetical protein [Prevotella sp.]